MAIKPKVEVIEETKTNEIAPVENTGAIIDVETSVEAWNNYQELCGKLLSDKDYQLYRDKDGKTKRFPKKSAWFKLGKVFNVNTEIIESTVYRAKNGQVK